MGFALLGVGLRGEGWVCGGAVEKLVEEKLAVVVVSYINSYENAAETLRCPVLKIGGSVMHGQRDGIVP